MRYLLIYYTGTHHTRYLTRRLKSRLESDGHEVTTVEIRCDTPPVDTADYDFVGLSYPIYGFNAPRPFNRYLRRLTFPKGQKYFIFKNSGEVMAMNNASSRVPKRIMRHKGASFCGEYHFVMPYNIHFRFPDAFVKEALEHNQKLMEIMLCNLARGVVSYPRSHVVYEIAGFFVSVQKIGGNVNSFFYRVNPDRCTGCGLCERNCPHKNILLKDGKVVFRHHCDMCMACSFFCPQDAIRIGFLERWHVNGVYPLAEIEARDSNDPPFIRPDTEGFYRCFIRYFEDIDRQYRALDAARCRDAPETPATRQEEI